MLRATTKLSLLFVASALAARPATFSRVSPAYDVNYKTMDEPGFGGGGDGPCYDNAIKVRDNCLEAAKAAGSPGAGEQCYLTYAAMVAACDKQMGQ